MASALDELICRAKFAPSSRVDSGALQNRHGGESRQRPRPDISTLEALETHGVRRKIAGLTPDSASGAYLSTDLFPANLGIWDQIKTKSKKIEADPVGGVVATGEIRDWTSVQTQLSCGRWKGIDIVGAAAVRARSR